jgi:hypothetical protein
MKKDIQAQIPMYIKVEDYHKYHLEPHDIRYNNGKVVSNPKTQHADMRILRRLQLSLMERGQLGVYVNWRYVVQLTGEKPRYIKMVLYRLARGGFVERHRKVYNYTKGLWNVYYWCAKIKHV